MPSMRAPQMKNDKPAPRTIRINQNGAPGRGCVMALNGEVERGVRELAHRDHTTHDQRESKELKPCRTENLLGNRQDQQCQSQPVKRDIGRSVNRPFSRLAPAEQTYFCFAVIFFSSAFIRRLSTSAGIG